MFCRFDLAIHYRAVKYAPEIIDLVHSGPFPSIVDDRLIAQLKHWATESKDLLVLPPPFCPGEIVELAEGPMQGLSARILNISNDRDRVAILLSILECGAQMVVSRCQLRKVS
jgi:transcription antitermination factor NusG